jgi:hypothetical protein
MHNYLVPMYAIYSAVSIGLVVWLAHTLFHNGEVFLEDVFEDNPRLAKAVNHLLVVGFYMANLGYAALLLQSNAATDGVEAVELLVRKLGVLMVSLAVLHFANMYVFYRIRRRATASVLPPPVMPQMRVPGVKNVADAR